MALPHIRFHDLRHTAATNMHQLTGDFYTVGEVLGHTLAGIGVSLGLSMNFEAVTARYVDVRLERKKEVLDAYHKGGDPFMSRDSETVSKNMRSIHSKDTSIELQLRKALWHKGYRYRKNYKALPGSPDIVLTKYKIAIFCDSEFFHGKDWEILKLRLEKGKNPDYWIKKIERNRSRDFETDKKLLFLGYTVIHFWGQDIKKHTDECIQAIEEAIWDSTFSDSSFDSSDE